MNSTTKTFFNVDINGKEVRRVNPDRATLGEYPILATAQREQQLANISALKKHSFIFTKHYVPTNSKDPKSPVTRKFRMTNSVHRQINKGNHMEIPSTSRINSLRA